jgi:hypothetical protein
MRHMTKLRIGLLVMLAASAAGYGYLRYRDHQDFLQATEQGRRHNEQARLAMQRANAERARQFIDRSMLSAIPSTYARPPSAWSTNEKRLYETALTGSHYDVLMVPLQVNDWGFDRASRSVMTAELTDAIARSQPGKVPDPYLIAKVLGDGQRRYPDQEIYRIAELVSAKRIIWGAVGHDQKGRMTVTILSQLRPEGRANTGRWTTSIAAHRILDIAFDDKRSPIEAFEQRIPDLLKSLGIEPPQPAVPGFAGTLDLGEIPESPLRLTEAADNPVREAYAFLLFGSLTPGHMERSRERFVEKAILALSRVSPTAPEYRALRARAYMMMGYRSAALEALGTPESAEERGVQAALNGNLPEVRAEAAHEGNPLKRFIAQLDANRIAADYGVTTPIQSLEKVKALNLPGRVWPFLAGRAFDDWDPWAHFDNASLKSLLDVEFPIKGFRLQDLLQGAVSIGDADKLQTRVDLSVFNHVQKYVADHALNWRDLPSGRFNALDYLELLSAQGHDNLIRQIDFLAHMQHARVAAMRYADGIQSVYQGFPYYTLIRSEAERLAADESSGAEREGLIKFAYEDVFNAMYWEQSQSRISSRALTDLGYLYRVHEYGYFGNFYSSDLPYHPLYMTWANGGDHATIDANGMAGLANATSEFGAVLEVAGSERTRPANDALIADVVSQIQQRFIGSPARGEFLAQQEALRGNPAAAEVLLRKDIKMTPANRRSYLDLGKIMLDSGQASAAAKVFRSYPGLRPDSKIDAVLRANTAYDMGSYFFNSGDLELAVPFYKIAASQGTGASSEMAAAMRMKILEGDINGALLSALERAQRYHDSRAFRDYLGMLHATKRSSDAWAGFGTLVRELQEPHIWETALVGHHIAAATEAGVTEWVKEGDLQSAGNHESYATTYLARFATTDRIPSKNLAPLIAEIDRPVWQFDTGARSVVRPDADGRFQRILGPAGAITSEGVLPIGVFENGGPKHRVRSELSYFVEAYRAVKLRDFSAAKRVFDEAATLYDIASPELMYMLPYYAVAGAKAGDVAGVEQVLGRIARKDQRFEYHLARAALEGVDGRIRDAVKSLKLARYRRPNTEEAVQLTQYVYGDLCETLHQLTDSPEIRGLALDWAKSREKTEPWQAWSYALEAVLTPNPVDRQRAIAMTYYLDPKSAHLASFKKSEIDEAVKTFGSFNPFIPRQAGRSRETST